MMKYPRIFWMVMVFSLSLVVWGCEGPFGTEVLIYRQVRWASDTASPVIDPPARITLSREELEVQTRMVALLASMVQQGLGEEHSSSLHQVLWGHFFRACSRGTLPWPDRVALTRHALQDEHLRYYALVWCVDSAEMYRAVAQAVEARHKDTDPDIRQWARWITLCYGIPGTVVVDSTRPLGPDSNALFDLKIINFTPDPPPPFPGRRFDASP
jgi:hypothetical protein